MWTIIDLLKSVINRASLKNKINRDKNKKYSTDFLWITPEILWKS